MYKQLINFAISLLVSLLLSGCQSHTIAFFAGATSSAIAIKIIQNQSRR